MGSFLWIALVTIPIVVAIWVWIVFVNWKKATLARLRDGAQVVETSKGPIECAVFGEGPAVLISHGVLGGYDQGLAGIASGFFGNRPYRFIALSRPGYLRTPPEVGRSPEEQADAFAALLDALKIEKVVMVGISGGGPPSLQFALRHAKLCRALLLVSAATARIPPKGPGKLALLFRAMMLADFPPWLMLAIARRFPTLGFRSIVSPEELRHIREPGVLMNLLRIMDSTAPVSARSPGLLIDGNYLTTLPSYPLSSIRVPTLLVHGTSDTIIPFASSERTAGTIPGARLIPIKDGSHFACLLRLGDWRKDVAKFLDQVAG